MPARLLLTAITLAGLTLPARAAEPNAAQVEFFEKQIRPLLLKRCSKCHGEKKQEAGLRLDQGKALLRGGDSGKPIQAGKPDESLLIRRIRSRGDERMPPENRLSEREIAALVKWVQEGAVWPDELPTKKSGPEPQSVSPIEANDPSLKESLELWLRADTLQRNDGEQVLVLSLIHI